MSRARAARRASFLPGSRIDEEFVAAWRALAARAAEPNPFAEPEFVLPAVRHLGDRSRAGLLTVGDRDRLVAVLPVTWPVPVAVAGSRTVPVPLVQAWVQPFRPLGAPLLDAADPAGAMAGLLRLPPSLPAPALLLRYFPEGGPVAAALDEALAARGQQALRLKTYERARLLRAGVPANKNRKNRYNRLRRHRDELAVAIGPTRVVDRADEPEAIERFLRLEAATWKGRAGTALACTDAHAAWFREVCDGMRAQGRLEVLSLEAGERTLAMWVDFTAGGGSFHLKSAYDESAGDHRPGAQLVLHCVETAAEGRYDWRDSCTVPDNTLFNQLWGDRRSFSTVLVPLHGPLGGAALRLAGTVQSLMRRRTADPQPRGAGTGSP